MRPRQYIDALPASQDIWYISLGGDDPLYEEFRDLIGATGEPTVAEVRHWPVGLPQYALGHNGLLKDLGTTNQRVPGLFLTGNYFAGPSVAVCLNVARKTATSADNYLAGELGVPALQSASEANI